MNVWAFWVAANDGGMHSDLPGSYEQRCNCPNEHGLPGRDANYDNWHLALCAADKWPMVWGYDVANTWLATNSLACPRGWGNLRWRYPDDRYSVQCAQGYTITSRTPVYGYVTRYRTQYRTAYYAYISARVAKA